MVSLLAVPVPPLFGSAAAIYFSCEFFVNGLEWVGKRLEITQTATGTILAAFGTALPESVVTLVAVAFGTSDAERDIGVGAALGGPLILSTLAYAVVGLTLIGSDKLKVLKKIALDVDYRRLSRDQAWFLGIFLCKLALGLVAFPGKRLFGFLFLAAYALYVWKELRSDASISVEAELERLKIKPNDADPTLIWAGLQTPVALIVIFAASRIFVSQLDMIGPWLGIMPETMNAIIWVRQGRERMALANISGAMMIQATIPTAFGLFWTPWLLQAPLLVAAGIAMAATVYLQWIFRKPDVRGVALVQVAWLYLAFGAIVTWRALA